MSIPSGTRLGVYEVTGALGAGGMGEVYRARDTKLGREVAIKIVTGSFDPERASRFRREAQLLAALNHPNIATIHGLEEVGPSPGTGHDAVQFLVMELVEGETLAGMIAASRLSALGSGPASDPQAKSPKTRVYSLGLPLDEALAIARQIADALQAAHEKGIIHRDLKPANIAFTASGHVKVLDFGLAKMTDEVESAEHDVTRMATHSPTLSLAATQAGVILGTAAYMAPEQAKGHVADKRCDIWAFGCVLYEMLTGARAFDGEDVSDIMGAVLRLEPDWTALPPSVPHPIRSLLKRCLEKDRRRRIADISTALFVLDEATGAAARSASGPAAFDSAHAGEAGHDVPAVSAADRSHDAASVRTAVEAAVATTRRELARSSWRRAAAFSTAALVAGAGAAWVVTRPAPPAPPRVERFTLAQTGTAALTINGTERDLAITPDGTRIIYVGSSGTQLLVRALDQLEPVVIASGGAFRAPFVSPDGQWVGFVENNLSLKKVAITGGPGVTISAMDGTSRGTTWAPDDTVIFATAGPTGLQRVSAAGGDVTVLTRPDRARGEADHVVPEILPGGRAVLFTITAATGGLDAAQVAVLDLNTGVQKTLVRGGSHGHYVPTGHLVYAAGGTLRAVAFDLDQLEPRGTPVPVLPRLVTTNTGAGDFALSADGTIVYADAPGTSTMVARTLVWVDRQGREQPLALPQRPYLYPRLLPDGSRVAVHVPDQQEDIWAWDFLRQTLTRLTFDPGQDTVPVWTVDGRRLIFSSARSGAVNLYWQPADGTGAAERLTDSDNQQYPTGVSPDGTHVVFYENHPTTRSDLMLLTLDGKRTAQPPPQGTGAPARRSQDSGEPGRSAPRNVRPLLQTPATERGGIISLDGRWLAYESDASGRFEVYVRPFPNVGDGQWQVSTAGGTRPVWGRNGQELFYVAPDGALMAVRVDARAATWSAGAPTKILEGRYFTGGGTGNFSRHYDVSSDGERFLMIKEAGRDEGAAPPQIVIVKNWFEELKRMVPGD